jgi:hypothetical protein
MLLSKTRRRMLMAYRKWKDQGAPTFWGFIGSRLVMHLAGATGLFIAGFVLGSSGLMCIAVGFLVGCVYSDSLRAHQVIRDWDGFASIVDWQRVDTLLAQDREEWSKQAPKGW